MIEWNVSPEIVTIGPITLRWYGILFALSFVLGFKIMSDIFKKEAKSEKDLNDLLWYMILGTVIGARLGHCLFYNPEYYLSNPIEILKIYQGGLASHGAAVGILTSIYLFVRRREQYKFLWLMDRLVITVALAAVFIRTGNLFNSEIIGRPTDVAWGFVFLKASGLDAAERLMPRHPAQLYEALAYLVVFVTLFTLYIKKHKELKDGFLFGVFMIGVFGFRFFVEFYKMNQTYFEEGMVLNMGQILSIPLILYGVYLVFTRSRPSVSKT